LHKTQLFATIGGEGEDIMIERTIYQKLKQELKTKEAIVLTGPRQVGKTETTKWLLSQVKGENKIYLDLTLASVRTLFDYQDYNNIINRLSEMGVDFSKHAVVAIDEIQYQKNLPEIVKYLYDSYDIKFILTGSSSFYLKNHFTESLSVRKVMFELMPFSFGEFLALQQVKYSPPAVTIGSPPKFDKFRFETLRSYYDEYIEYGGFPAVISSDSAERKRQMLDTIFSSYINLDVEQLADFKSTSDLRRLISLLGARVGSQVNVDELANILGLSRPTVSNYISFLEQTYLIRLVPAYSGIVDTRERIPKKVYFVDNGIANINADLSGGAKFENMLCHQLRLYGKLHFYNVKDGEIDFVLQASDKNLVAIEAKESPTEKYQRVLERRAEKLGAKSCYLIGRHESASFSDYVWGGDI
jgi:predicted AAA+ superfamily ATPase